MNAYLQINRPMKIATPIGPDALLLVGVSGHEGISEPFQFHLELMALKELVIPFEKILGQPVTVTIDLPGEAKTRYFHGIVRDFTERECDETFVYFEAEIVPKFWLWTKKAQSRIFQHLSVPEILAEVLEGLEVRYDLAANYSARDYCVQYRESDFAFASRLMEEEGIFYYFLHDADKHVMVVSDNVVNLPQIAEVPMVTYQQRDAQSRKPMQVTAWKKTQSVCSVKHTVWDYSFELPGQNLEAVETVPDSVKVGMVDHPLDVVGDSLEVYDYPGGYAKHFDGVDSTGSDRSAELAKIFEANVRTARLRAQVQAAKSLLIRGQSNCLSFNAGCKFNLLRHRNADGAYYLVRVEHEAKCNPTYRSGSDDTALEYHNHFQCLPADLVYRPPATTPKPTISGPQTATVVGAPGQQMLSPPAFPEPSVRQES